MNASGHQELAPYREIDALEVDPGFAYSQEGRMLRWTCPQCRHDCVHDLRPGWLFGLGPRDRGEAEAVIVECCCRRDHREPDDEAASPGGCGCFFKHG